MVVEKRAVLFALPIKYISSNRSGIIATKIFIPSGIAFNVRPTRNLYHMMMCSFYMRGE
jgi:hypothetical protein